MPALSPPETFKRRAEFLRMASRGRKIAKPGFVMQLCSTESRVPLRAGYTATKKIGNAVMRNRARRRLKEAARLTLAGRDLSGVELVLICRQETGRVAFEKLCDGIEAALAEGLK
jgi:ribonuclease P protein component